MAYDIQFTKHPPYKLGHVKIGLSRSYQSEQFRPIGTGTGNLYLVDDNNDVWVKVEQNDTIAYYQMMIPLDVKSKTGGH